MQGPHFQQQGGAMHVLGGSVTVVNASYVISSSAVREGGAMYVYAGSMTVSNGSWVANSSTIHSGGTMFLIGGSVTVANDQQRMTGEMCVEIE